MLFSLIHTEIGSSSQYKLFAFEQGRLLQSLFGYLHLTISLMEHAFFASVAVSSYRVIPRASHFYIILSRSSSTQLRWKTW
jgi:hypothetical protein